MKTYLRIFSCLVLTTYLLGGEESFEEGSKAIPFLPERVEPLFIVQEPKPPPLPEATLPILEEECWCDLSCEEKPPGPWFTGPLLTPSSKVVPGGFFNLEPYLYDNVITGKYDRHWHAKKKPNFYNIGTIVFIQIGLTKWMDIQFVPQATYSRTQGKSSSGFNDFPIRMDFQLYDGKDKAPNLKFIVQELFPTGRYQHLHADKLGTDSGGGGCFVTQIGFVLGRIHHISCDSYFSWRLNPFYTFQSSTTVHGINTYGGVPDTRGKIHLGSSYGVFLGLEYSLNQNWVLAMDAFGIHQEKNHFMGRPGRNADGTKATVGAPSSTQFSLAPGIEYNWSEALGIIVGPWFSIAGRNSNRFITALFALNYYGPIPKRKCKTPYCKDE